jgi:hypothetical protein
MSSARSYDSLFDVAASTHASSMDDALAMQASQTAAFVAVLLPAAEQAIVYLAANASELVNNTLTRLPEVADKVADVCVSERAMRIFSARYMHHYYLSITYKAWPLSSPRQPGSLCTPWHALNPKPLTSPDARAHPPSPPHRQSRP